MYFIIYHSSVHLVGLVNVFVNAGDINLDAFWHICSFCGLSSNIHPSCGSHPYCGFYKFLILVCIRPFYGRSKFWIQICIRPFYGLCKFWILVCIRPFIGLSKFWILVCICPFYGFSKFLEGRLSPWWIGSMISI